MTKQAPYVVALKAAFFERYGIQLNARIAGGSQRDCLVLAVPADRNAIAWYWRCRHSDRVPRSTAHS